ncbi:MAG TPA: hypothetical protein VNJ08_14190 [Bacteriovoracaceae bacterium]|nr:hypothetical protein [Bacteriovoracaceae bacterium]
MAALKVAEKVKDSLSVRSTLESYERSKILEVYFARVDGRIPRTIPLDVQPLYALDLVHIRAFLLGHYPQDNLFNKIFKMIN